VQIYGEAATAVAKATITACSEKDINRRIEVRYDKNGVPHILFSNIDLDLLGISRD